MSLIVLKDIKKVYSNKNHYTFALNGINLTINKGEYTLNEKTLTENRANKVHKTRNEMILVSKSKV
ncbi:hypothetical protein BK716_27775 [Bacillus thuringiensis serovar higo]|uniref:Uncharacterized protein n=1 Tax=Bacillus thuringiensis subsp. higo TaxID=132266 RepID=A0A9X6LDU2_BACUH|nr:hypothetical protein BK716_27775 [Bacillus thuringiensis serovar higo]